MTSLARVHFHGIAAACVSITGEIIVAHSGDRAWKQSNCGSDSAPVPRKLFPVVYSCQPNTGEAMTSNEAGRK